MVPIVGPILEESRKKAAAKVLEVGLVDGLKHLGENDGPDIADLMKKALGEDAARKVSVTPNVCTYSGRFRTGTVSSAIG